MTAVHVISMNGLLSFYYLITSVYLHKQRSHRYDSIFWKLLSYRHGGVCNAKMADL